MDADMECEVPLVIAVAWSFDAFEVVFAHTEGSVRCDRTEKTDKGGLETG